ncbi:MAG: PKD domain-containing protein, partial [Solirubrobacterales bacterium]|nr:PKD domain-containing protein [Solirubrobacterales bacterium]
PQVALRAPSTENAPAIGIAQDGNGVVAWQEPEASGGPARIWVRRLFGAVQGNVLQASPATVDGRPVTSDADAPALAVGPYGEARIAYRIRGVPGFAVSATQLYTNALPAAVSPQASQLEGAVPLPGATQAPLGPPSVALGLGGSFRLAWAQGGAVQLAGSGRSPSASPAAIGAAGGSVQTSVNPAGGGTTAWTAPPGAPPAVLAREEYAGGAFQSVKLAGEIPGPITGMSLGGNGQGDALIGFMQGPPGRSEVAGAFVQAPPASFTVTAPSGWLRAAASAPISWEAAPDALAGVTYAVYLDGDRRLRGLTGLHARLPLGGLGDGVHRVQVLATDAAGQRTMSPAAALRVDVDPPIVRVRPIDRRRGVRVLVADRASGVNASATVVSFGDGRTIRGRATVAHAYRRPGGYTIVAHVRDLAGNGATVRLRVRVR